VHEDRVTLGWARLGEKQKEKQEILDEVRLVLAWCRWTGARVWVVEVRCSAVRCKALRAGMGRQRSKRSVRVGEILGRERLRQDQESAEVR
jgi:hypothetical protein